MFAKMKDLALSKTAKALINSQIKEFGEVLGLDLNSTNKSIELEVKLDGEASPLKVNIGRYEILKKDDKYFVKLNDIKTSRAWINTVASSYLEGKEFEIPSEYGGMIEKVL